MRADKGEVLILITTLEGLTGEDRENCWWEIYDVVVMCENRDETEEWKRLREEYEGECFR